MEAPPHRLSPSWGFTQASRLPEGGVINKMPDSAVKRRLHSRTAWRVVMASGVRPLNDDTDFGPTNPKSVVMYAVENY